MVAIRRRKTKSKSVTSSFLSSLTIRNIIIIGVIAFLGIRLLWRATTEKSSNQDVVNGNDSSSKQSMLKDSKGRLSDRHKKEVIMAHEIVQQRRRKEKEEQISNIMPEPNDRDTTDLEHSKEEKTKHPDEEDNRSQEISPQQEQQLRKEDEFMKNEKNKKDDFSDSERSTEMVLKKHGTGHTQVGYVVDLDYERKYPAFRKDQSTTIFDSTYYMELERRVLGQLKKDTNHITTIHACEQLIPITSSSQEEEDSNNNKGRNSYHHLNSNGISHRIDIQSKCYDEDTRLVVYNGADFQRHVCGQVLEPHSSLILREDCHFFPGSNKAVREDGHLPIPPIHLLPLDNPPVSGHGMPPIQIVGQIPQSSSSDNTLPSLETVTCDIPCEWESNLLKDDNNKPGKRFVIGTDWKITYNDRDPSLDHNAQIERTAYRHNHYYATTSWQSVVPLSTFSFDKYDLRKAPAIHYDEARNAATSVLSEKCSGTLIRRQKWMSSAAANLKSVHYYGSCQHNTEIPHGLSLSKLDDRIELMKKDRIVLAYEESTEPYHVTDIVWEALMSGAVPAILGASNLEPDILPPNAALYGSTYNNWDDFSKYVQTVADDKERWESFHRWRTDDVALTTFEERLNFTRTPPHCRLCRWAYAKKYGLGWNHRQQTVQPNHIRHQLCLSSESDPSLVVKPFRESWSMGDQAVTVPSSPHDDGTDIKVTCQEQHQTTTILDKIERLVWHHDGFTDMIIRPKSDDHDDDGTTVVLQVQVNILNHEGALFRDVHTLVPKALRIPFVSSAAIQDKQSKVTILTNFIVTNFRSPKTGVLELQIPTSSTTNELKLRIITEDFNELQDKLTEYYPSSYAQMAMKDFIDPIEVFYVAS